jgi:DNA-binding LytR/AlgR family response regulator
MNQLTCAIFVDDKEIESQLVENIRKTSSIDVLYVLKNNFELVEKIHQKPTDILFISTCFCEILQNINQPPFVIVIEKQKEAARSRKRNLYFDVLSIPLQEQNLCDVLGKVFKIANTYRTHPETMPSLVSEKEFKYEVNEPVWDAEQMFIKHGKISYKIVFDEVLYIKNVGNSLQIKMVNGKSYFYRSTLKKFFNLLPPNKFARINKSVVVNFTKINSFQNQQVSLQDEKFMVSRIYIVRLRELLRLKRP